MVDSTCQQLVHHMLTRVCLMQIRATGTPRQQVEFRTYTSLCQQPEPEFDLVDLHVTKSTEGFSLSEQLPLTGGHCKTKCPYCIFEVYVGRRNMFIA